MEGNCKLPSFSSTTNYATWQQTYLTFNDNLLQCMHNYNLPTDLCLKQLLQSLTNKELPEKGKLLILTILQNYSDVFSEDRKNVCSLLIFLEKYYRQLMTKTKRTNKNFLLESQVLVTWTTVVILNISSENMDDFMELKSSFMGLFDELLQLILNINNVDNCVIRSVVCDCLIEIEIAFPKTLASMLETLKDIYNQEMTYVYQKYALLLSVAAKHEYALKTDPFSITQQIISQVRNTTSITQTLLTSPSIIDVQEKQVLTSLMECLSSSSNHIGSIVVGNVANIILKTKSTPNSILKGFVHRYRKTYDVNILHLICQLQMDFGRDLFTEEAEQHFLLQLFHLAHLPLIPSSQRLLCLDWLQYYSNPTLNMKLDYHFALKFCPSYFDGWETVMKKFFVLTFLLIQDDNIDVNGETLWNCIHCAYQVADSGMYRRSAVTTFRILLIFLKNFGKNFHKEIVEFITKLLHDHPQFAPNIVNYVNCVNEVCLESALSESIWQSLVQFIAQSVENCHVDTLPYYFVILNEVARSSKSRSCTQKIVNFFHTLVASDICDSGSWILGNCILKVCYSLLHYRDCNDFFTELGDILHAIFTKYNDVDVQDYARFLYMSLMSLSTQKIQTMFSYEVVSPYQHNNISSSLDTEKAHFGLADRIILLPESPIELIKESESFENIEESIFNNTEMPNSTLELYQDYVAKKDCTKDIQICCKLQFRNETLKTDKFQKLFCIEIQFVQSATININNITVPILEKDEFQIVKIKLKPNECKPVLIRASAIFSTVDCSTFVCNLSPISLTFEDCFLPLPVPPDYFFCKKDWRARVFAELWDAYCEKEDQSNTNADSNSQESVHVIHLKASAINACIEQRLCKCFIDTDNSYKRIGIFLPPNNHILLKFEVYDHKTVVRIVVDHWKILPFLNDFLLSLEK